MIRVIGYMGASLILSVVIFVGWLLSLPRLDPTGKEDSGPAVRAMIEGKAVRNTVNGWPMTKTGWPFFDRYSPEDKK